MKLSAVVLAAGRSSRMGTNKLLLKIGGRTVIEHIIFNLKPLETIVVTGHTPEVIKDLAEGLEVKVVHNPYYNQGMTTSFQAGLRALDKDVDAVFMVLSDNFGFRHELLERMVIAMENDSGTLIVSPVYRDQIGHPVLFRRDLFNEFLELGGAEIMNNVVKKHVKQHRCIEGDIWCTVDLDTLEDYEIVKTLWSYTRASVE